MKKFFFVPVIVVALITSCKKSDSSSSGNGGGGGAGTQLVRIQEGTDPSTDTVFKLTYANNKIATIYDSIYYGSTADADTVVTVYDANGRLVSLKGDGEIIASYTYDANGLLTEIDDLDGDRYVYTYTNGIVSQKSWYTNFGGGGALTLYETYKFTVTNGNITDIQTYDASNTLLGELSVTFGSQTQPATFKELALINISNVLGTDNFAGDDYASFDTYFNTNVITGYSESGSNAMLTNTFTSQQVPAQIVAFVPDTFIGVSVGTYTWLFSYE